MSKELWCEGRRLASKVREAEGMAERLRGLIGRVALEEGECLLLHRARQVHTFGMRFPIDVVFCDDDMRVLHVRTNMRPNRISRVVLGGRHVFELAAGAAEGLAKGSRLQLV